jgi:hypothetical protein
VVTGGLVALCLVFAAPAAADWHSVGDDLGMPGPGAVAAEGIGGVPYIAWIDQSGGLRVERLSDDGAHWLMVGDAPANAGVAGAATGVPALVDAAGVPYVAWTQRSASSDHFQVHVARFDSGTGTWSEPDAANLAVNSADQAADSPKLAFFGGQVYVAWTERLLTDSPPSQLYVKRLVAGSSWQQPVSGSLNANDQHGAQGPHIAISAGKLWVAWAELTPHGADAATYELLVKRLRDDGTWDEPPAPRPTPSDSNYSNVLGLSDGGGTPYLLYIQSDAQGNTSLHVKRLAADGAAWDPVGGELKAERGSAISVASLGQAGGVPYVAWGDRVGTDPTQMRVARLNSSGDGWEEPVATSLNADPRHFAGPPAVTNNLPTPYVAWAEAGAAPAATVVKRLEPSLSMQAVDFGAEPLGTVSEPRSVVFRNPTSSPVHIAPGAVAIAGPDAAAFGISSDGCSSTTVERGGSCTLGLTFTPQAVRAHQATLSLTSDSPGSPYTATLTGTSPGPAPPAGAVGISINSGAQFTNDPDVDVRAVWQLGDNTVLLANDGGFAGAEATPLAEHIPWRLDSSGPERLPKTVYARFDTGNQTFTDDIILDETAPTLSSVTFAAKRRVHIAARDRTSGLRSYQLTRKKAHPGKRHRFHRTVHYAGKRRKLYVRVFDRAGNHSRWVRAKHARRH